MSYLLDHKKNLASTVIPVGPDSIVTVYKGFDIKPDGADTSFFSVGGSGDIAIGAPGTVNNLVIESSINFPFKKVTDITLNIYMLTQTDYSIEIVSDTIDTVLLPTALGSGGRTYIISRTSNNNNLVVQAQPNETIDGRNIIKLNRKGLHFQIQSNDADTWYCL